MSSDAWWIDQVAHTQPCDDWEVASPGGCRLLTDAEKCELLQLLISREMFAMWFLMASAWSTDALGQALWNEWHPRLASMLSKCASVLDDRVFPYQWINGWRQ